MNNGAFVGSSVIEVINLSIYKVFSHLFNYKKRASKDAQKNSSYKPQAHEIKNAMIPKNMETNHGTVLFFVFSHTSAPTKKDTIVKIKKTISEMTGSGINMATSFFYY